MRQPIVVKNLFWDSWNVEHIAKHKVTVKEVETALLDKKVKSLKAHDGRLMILGRIGVRLLAIILAEESRGRYYVVTARDMDKKERKIYRGGIL